mgnify:CR=1 FL=1
MGNCMIGFPNRIDSATLSGGSWSATLPRANIQNKVLGKVARSSDAALASTKFDMDLGAAKNIRLISVINHNCSLASLIRIRGASDSGFTAVLYDSGWVDVWAPVYSSLVLEWEDDNWWDGKYTDEQRAGYTSTFVQAMAANVLARYWRIEIDDTANAAGYVQIGRVFIGSAWQPVYGMDFGATLGWETKTAIQEALGGAEYFQRRTPYRVAQFQTNLMSIDEGLGNAFDIQRRAGIDAEVLWVQDPADTLHALRRRFLGRMRQLSPMLYPYANAHSTAFEIKELL